MVPRGDDQGEYDVDDDEDVAQSRAGKGDEDGSYVGRTGSDDAVDAGETGAEARGEHENR
jgi:hypothetical protein